MFFSLERDIALSIGRVPERDDFNEILAQKETALKDLELESAKLVRRLLKETLRNPLQPSLCLSPGSLHMPLASVATEIIAAGGGWVGGWGCGLCDNEAQGMGIRP